MNRHTNTHPQHTHTNIRYNGKISMNLYEKTRREQQSGILREPRPYSTISVVSFNTFERDPTKSCCMYLCCYFRLCMHIYLVRKRTLISEVSSMLDGCISWNDSQSKANTKTNMKHTLMHIAIKH